MRIKADDSHNYLKKMTKTEKCLEMVKKREPWKKIRDYGGGSIAYKALRLYENEGEQQYKKRSRSLAEQEQKETKLRQSISELSQEKTTLTEEVIKIGSRVYDLRQRVVSYFY